MGCSASAPLPPLVSQEPSAIGNPLIPEAVGKDGTGNELVYSSKKLDGMLGMSAPTTASATLRTAWYRPQWMPPTKRSWELAQRLDDFVTVDVRPSHNRTGTRVER